LFTAEEKGMKTVSYWLATVLTLSLALSMLRPPIVADASESKGMRHGHGHHLVTWKPKRHSDAITVMTQNVYVGADVDAILAVQDPNQIPVVVALTFQQLLSTGFFERAATVAEQIARTRPHLIGLQEISLIRVQFPGDALSAEPTPAEDVLFDYLEILLQALKARQLHYRVVGKIKNADVEPPMLVSPAPLVPTDVFTDVRLTDFDVVLARGDVQIFKKSIVEKNYSVALEIPDLGIAIPRGYVAVDARIKHRTYRFVNTHLEPAAPGVRLAQAQELLEALADEKKPVIVVGDLNTPAPSGETYEEFVSKGFVDVWTRNLKEGEGEGFTFQHDFDLRNTGIKLKQRIDLIFVRNLLQGETLLGPVLAKVWGDELSERTPSGLWPSDHAGVIARMRIPVFRRW
jgi:hypothetical protein